jgi:large subunit ribosomal protein L15
LTIRFPKKLRKRRGYRTHGYGRISQHRKSGQRGGKGHSGLKKHLKSWMLKNNPDYFGKYGFKRPEDAYKPVNAINLRELNRIINKKTELIKDAKSKTIKIDLNQYGYQKLLGKGNIKIPIEITVKKATESARNKIKSSGGTVIVPK